MTGLLASEAELSDVSIEGCRLDLAAFAEATIEHARVVGCDLRGSSWQAANLREVSFEDCDLSEADLTEASFEGVAMRGCRLEGIRDAAELRGISMSWGDVVANAALFATACGIEIEDD